MFFSYKLMADLLKTIFLSFLEAAFNQVLLVLQKVLCASSIPAFQIRDNTVIILKTVLINLSFVLNILLCFMISFTKHPSSKYIQLREQHSPSQKQGLPPDQTHNYISLLHLPLKAPFPLKRQQVLGEAIVSRTSSSWKKSLFSF